MLKFSIIIPDTDSTRMGRILEALKNQSVDLSQGEIIVVGSDKPDLVVRDNHVRFIQTSEEDSFASDKRNIGMRAAKGDVFLFHDDDCVPNWDWIEGHLRWQERGEKIVGGSVAFPRGNYLQLADNLSAFHFMTPTTQSGYRTYLCTSNLSIHRSVLDQVGEMHPHQNRADDLEWTLRMRSLGFPLYFDPQIVVLHDPERTSFAQVWRHWIVDAPPTLAVRLRYAQLLGTPPLASCRPVYLWGSPFVAAWATWRTFSNRNNLISYWHTMPLVYLTKLVWCWSAYRNFPSNNPQRRMG
jgi:GT2 family glycosyltransferase